MLSLKREIKYWKLKRAYNSLLIKYETIQKEDEYKDRVITRKTNEIEKVKKELEVYKNEINNRKYKNQKF